MSSLSISRTYDTGVVLTEADLDAICNGVETFLNTTKISDDNIQTGGITGSSKLADATVTAAKLASDSVTTAKILDSNVTTAKLNDLAVTAGKLASDSVTTVKILDSNVTTAKINDLAVTTGKINDLAVTTAKIAALNVTRAKIEAVGQQVSNSSGTNSPTSTIDIPNCSVTITTTGRPVLLFLQPDGSGSIANLTNDTGTSSIHYKRDGSSIAVFGLYGFGANGSTKGFHQCVFLDPVAAGTYTYKATYTHSSGNGFIDYVKMVAYEL
jgi:hypothetical protein